MSFLPNIDWLYVLIFVGLGGGLAYEHYHLIHEGESKIEAQDKAAKIVLDQQVAGRTAALQQAADQAAKDRDATQNELDAYRAAHPVTSVLVCHENHSSPGLPQASGSHGGAANSSSGSAPVPEVLGRSSDQSVDVGPELDTILRAAGELGTLYREDQEQLRAHP